MKVNSYNPTEAYIKGQTQAIVDNAITNMNRCLNKLLEAYEQDSKKGISLFHEKWDKAHQHFMNLLNN